MFVSGSFKLGINSPDGDIDIVGIAPMHVTRDDFFASLPLFLRVNPGITSLLPIPEANVPIIELVFHGVSIDLLFASIPTNTVPASLNILDDAILAGVDDASMRALNGPRANEIIYRSVPHPETFKVCSEVWVVRGVLDPWHCAPTPTPPSQVVLRALRFWATMRALYSNKLGFLGGINVAILRRAGAWDRGCQCHRHETGGAFFMAPLCSHAYIHTYIRVPVLPLPLQRLHLPAVP
jgi:poly(A) polymerase